MFKLIGFFTVAGGLVVGAAPSSIGFVRSTGDFRVDGAIVRGNGTLFAGNVVETMAARSTMQMGDVQLSLGPESRARVYADRTVLEKGSGTLRDAGRHVFEAAGLRVAPAAQDAVVQVEVKGPSRIAVVAVSGGAAVHNSLGLLVGRVSPGGALLFDTNKTGANPSLDVTGTVTVRDGKYFLTDQTSGITVELRGADIDKYVGQRVEVTGSVIPDATPAPGATEVAQVTAAHTLGTVAAGGISAGAKAAIIGGVVVGGTTGGLAAAGTFTSSPSTSAH